MKQFLAAISACLVLGLVAIGCGGDDDSDSGDSGSATTAEQTATTEKQASGGGAATGKQLAIEIVDIDYEPKHKFVDNGVTVKWTNTGKLPHTVTKKDGRGPDFDSGTLQPGDTYEETFTTSGRVVYHCTIHSGQEGSITVQ